MSSNNANPAQAKQCEYIARMRVAKSSDENTKTAQVQALYEHLEGTAQIASIHGKHFSAKHITGILGRWHDFGKGTAKFGSYIRKQFENSMDKSKRGSVDHSTSGAIRFYEMFSSSDPHRSLLAEIVSLSIASHHGGFIDMISPDAKTPFANRLGKDREELSYDEASEAFAQMYPQEVLESEFNLAVQELKSILERIGKDKNDFHFCEHLLVKLLYSCLIDADRYDSYRYMEHKDSFKLCDGDNNWDDMSVKLESYISKLNRHTGSTPSEQHISKLRRQISDACQSFGARDTGIYSLTVPTGGGKTLSSLRFAIEHCKARKKRRIIYVLPYTTIIEQNAGEVRSILGKNAGVLEHHSNVICDNKDEDYKLATQRWDSPIIFTSMVQFLNSIYSKGTQNIRRMQALTNAVIIFDEIQAIPIKCIDLFTSAVNFLRDVCDTTSVLCTATQPALDKTVRRIIKSSDSEITPNVGEVFKAFKRVNVVDKRVKGGYTISELADFALEQMESKDSMLIIVNTKGDANKLYRKMADKAYERGEKYHFVHLSKSMCPEHRLEVLKRFKDAIGRERVICISTQLIEAGVNISTQCVIRALAGLDSIAQAAGRCNRHGEYGLSDVYIVNIRDENLGNLEQIKRGQEEARRVLAEFSNTPEKFDNDLLSPKLMELYYNYFFKVVQPQMKYPIDNGRNDLYSMLDKNEAAIQAFGGQKSESYKCMFRQAYKTAAEKFTVIENAEKSYLVPWGDGKQIIDELNGACSTDRLIELVRQAQHYSVDLFNASNLSKDMCYQLACGEILAIREQYYDKDVGVVTNPLEMDLMEV